MEQSSSSFYVIGHVPKKSSFSLSVPELSEISLFWRRFQPLKFFSAALFASYKFLWGICYILSKRRNMV